MGGAIQVDIQETSNAPVDANPRLPADVAS